MHTFEFMMFNFGIPFSKATESTGVSEVDVKGYLYMLHKYIQIYTTYVTILHATID